MIYTSYFANLKWIKNPISIALSSPRWYRGYIYSKLAPTWPILNTFKKDSLINYDSAVEAYSKSYRNNILSNLNQQTVADELQAIYPNEDIVLLCYEAPDKFCHRHLVAQWFNEAGIEVKEFEINKIK